LLSRWRKLVDTVPVHDLLDRIYAIYTEGNIIQRYAASIPASQQQRVNANLLRFLELSLELDSGRYPSLSHFLHHLRSIPCSSSLRTRPEPMKPAPPVTTVL